MSKIVVVFHSGYGHTEKQAQAVAQGAKAQLIPIDAEGNLTPEQWAALHEADAIVLGRRPTWGWRVGNLRNLRMPAPNRGSPSSGRTKSSVGLQTPPP